MFTQKRHTLLFSSISSQQTFVLMKTSWRHLFTSPSKDVFKTSSRRLDDEEYILIIIRLQKTSWSRPIYSSCPYIFKTSSTRLQDIFKTSSRLFIHFHCLSQYMCGHNLIMKFPLDFYNYTGLNGLVNSFSLFTIAPPNKLILSCKPHWSAKRKNNIIWDVVVRCSAKKIPKNFL